jgi:sulfatase maturation enzyme AslB (radical SAM superfamily)
LRYKKIFIADQCNNNCLPCPFRQKYPSQPDLDTIITLLKQKKEDNVVFYGGEPTLRNDLLGVILAAKKNGYRRIKLLTNGRAFSDIHFLQKLVSSGCYLFEIKLWGSNPSLHDHITQLTGSFQETIQGLENLAGLPHEKFVSVRIPVCKENYADLENTVITALNFGINRVILSFHDYKLAFGKVLSHIKNAINISIFNRIWILTEGLPFCTMHGLENHMGEIYYGWDTIFNRTFQHHTHCMDCIFRELCPGVETRYLEQFGEKEFSPVTANKYLKDIKALYE